MIHKHKRDLSRFDVGLWSDITGNGGFQSPEPTWQPWLPVCSVVTEGKMVDLATAACSELRPKHFGKYLPSQPGIRYRLPGDNHR